jgi:hypothetical protein
MYVDRDRGTNACSVIVIFNRSSFDSGRPQSAPAPCGRAMTEFGQRRTDSRFPRMRAERRIRFAY